MKLQKKKSLYISKSHTFLWKKRKKKENPVSYNEVASYKRNNTSGKLKHNSIPMFRKVQCK